MEYGDPEIIADIVKHEHANMDSFPFRYGIHFEKSTPIQLFNCENYEWQEFKVTFKVNANFKGKNYNTERGKFILMYKDGYTNPKVVTVIREDIETERLLSSLLKSLRKAYKITPQKLMDLHPLYKEGKANSFDKLAEILYSNNNKTNITNDELEAIKIEAKREAEEDHKKTKLELEKVRANAEEYSQKTKLELEKVHAIANESIKLNEAAAEALGEKEKENKILQEENKKLQNEKEQVRRQGVFNLVVDEAQILISVDTNVMYRGSINTILTLKDGSKKSIKVASFDKNLEVTKKAQSLIGKKIKTTAWDPINDPGKWSSQGYFRHIYEID